MAVALVLMLQVVATWQPSCREVEVTAMLHAYEQVARGDDDAARQALEQAAGDACELRALAFLSLRGWAEARALAPLGGPIELLSPVRRTLDALQALGRDSALAVEVEYAATCIRAAVAAAQDERPEMELLLIHARDLSERLLLRDKRAMWPRSFNLVAGELWFEVDRYADAQAAYDRAVRADASPAALVGLARAHARLEQWQQACDAYKRVLDAAPALRAVATAELARCQ
jgi:tetratricopeptide (TPR) repeat protein